MRAGPPWIEACVSLRGGLAALNRRGARDRLEMKEEPRRFSTSGATISQSPQLSERASRDRAVSGLRDDSIAIVEGTQLGRYEVVAPIGCGSMGIVFEALDTELDHRVALKVVRPHAQELEAAWSWLRREAQLMARISHPNVAAVLDLGSFDDHLFLAMELVRGGTLRDLVGRPRPWRAELRALIDAGRGLAAAHEAGVIHRDIKPDNVLVRTDGAVRIADFGVACEPDAHGGRGPRIAGTPAYMAPEGWGGAAGAATDQFAFAVTAFEILEKRLPFEVEPSPADHVRALRQGHAPWRRRAVPVQARSAIDRGMALDPSERWPSMRAMCAALEACLDVTPVSVRVRSYRPTRRRIG